MQPLESILIIAPPIPVALEFARLAVAAGFEPIWLNMDAPLSFEPWHEGVHWGAGDPSQVAPVVVITFGEDAFAESIPKQHDRYVIVVENPSPIAAVLEAIVLETGPVVEDGEGLRVETVAMAALRCCLEHDRRGIYTRDEIAYIGDAMMLQ